MPKKSFSFYTSADEFTIESSDKFVIELGKSHLVCVLTKANRKVIKAFEFFDFVEKDLETPDALFASVLEGSKLLNGLTGNIHVYINSDVCIPVPIFKFNKEIAASYLELLFGNESGSKIQFEHLPIEPGIMNVFRVSGRQEAFLKFLPKVSYHHTYSNVIRRHTANAGELPHEFISVQFYITYSIVLVIKDGKLNLIQSSIYENSEDVLYYLLSVCEHFQLNCNSLVLQISGMIDLEFKLYRELIKYFRQVHVENIEPSVLLPELNEYPRHYFTPFFNLAV